MLSLPRNVDKTTSKLRRSQLFFCRSKRRGALGGHAGDYGFDCWVGYHAPCGPILRPPPAERAERDGPALPSSAVGTGLTLRLQSPCLPPASVRSDSGCNPEPALQLLVVDTDCGIHGTGTYASVCKTDPRKRSITRKADVCGLVWPRVTTGHLHYQVRDRLAVSHTCPTPRDHQPRMRVSLGSCASVSPFLTSSRRRPAVQRQRGRALAAQTLRLAVLELVTCLKRRADHVRSDNERIKSRSAAALVTFNSRPRREMTM